MHLLSTYCLPCVKHCTRAWKNTKMMALCDYLVKCMLTHRVFLICIFSFFPFFLMIINSKALGKFDIGGQNAQSKTTCAFTNYE